MNMREGVYWAVTAPGGLFWTGHILLHGAAIWTWSAAEAAQFDTAESASFQWGILATASATEPAFERFRFQKMGS